jgi:hypothetical protein
MTMFTREVRILPATIIENGITQYKARCSDKKLAGVLLDELSLHGYRVLRAEDWMPWWMTIVCILLGAGLTMLGEGLLR